MDVPTPAPGSQEWIDKHMSVARELSIKSANSVLWKLYVRGEDEFGGISRFANGWLMRNFER